MSATRVHLVLPWRCMLSALCPRTKPTLSLARGRERGRKGWWMPVELYVQMKSEDGRRGSASRRRVTAYSSPAWWGTCRWAGGTRESPPLNSSTAAVRAAIRCGVARRQAGHCSKWTLLFVPVFQLYYVHRSPPCPSSLAVLHANCSKATPHQRLRQLNPPLAYSL